MAGCGSCGKPRPGPQGSTQKQAPEPKKPSTSMGGQTQSFRLHLADGNTMRIQGTLLEAQSMLIRKGGGRLE
jgi:hypothetical protein